MKALRFIPALAVVVLLQEAALAGDDLETLLPTLMARTRDDIAFPELVKVATEKQVLAVNLADAETARIVAEISGAFDRTLVKLNDPEHPSQKTGRINEAGNLLEETLRAELDAVPGFACDFPQRESGAQQRPGYPDLRLVDEKTGRVCYLDPKLFAQGTATSSFRSFYYEPRAETNKIMDDGHHLLAGIDHAPGEAGLARRFVSWRLIDLAKLRVRLKAEFQANNRDVYKLESVVAEGAR